MKIRRVAHISTGNRRLRVKRSMVSQRSRSMNGPDDCEAQEHLGRCHSVLLPSPAASSGATIARDLRGHVLVCAVGLGKKLD